MVAWRKPIQVMSARMLELLSLKRENASTTARSIRKKSAPVAGISLMPMMLRITQ